MYVMDFVAKNIILILMYVHYTYNDVTCNNSGPIIMHAIILILILQAASIIIKINNNYSIVTIITVYKKCNNK